MKHLDPLLRLEAVYYFDLSNETGQIFDAHLNKFLEELLSAVDTHLNSEELVGVLEGTLDTIDSLVLSLGELTACLFQDSPVNLEDCCFAVFAEMCSSLETRAERIKELSQQHPRLTRLVEEEKCIKEDEELDKEIEEFQAKLANQTVAKHRLRPMISNEWVVSLNYILSMRIKELSS